MKNLLKPHLGVVLGLLLLGGPVQAQLIFGTNSTWRYFKGRTEASTPDSTAWRAPGFDDSAWDTGNGAFYYGEPLSGTLLGDMRGGYTCMFLRKTFEVTNLAEIGALYLDTLCDDGFIGWINGVEVARFNMPDGEVAYDGDASSALEPSYNRYTLTNLQALQLSAVNVIALQGFNDSISDSSDFVMDASLIAVERDPDPPTVLTFDPPSGTRTSLTGVSVTFSEPVTNVQAGDLLINGVPATSVLGSGDTYAFFFPQPAYGTVQVGWSSLHGITDLGVPPNPFDAAGPGATWSYDLVDAVAPTVVAWAPLPGAVVASLSQIEVTFSETVAGVDAADLLVNGAAATNLVEPGPGRYLFLFAAPDPGLVTVEWSGTSGIQDLAVPPNDFAGGSWSYTVDPNAAAEDLIITEFMAANNRTLEDEDGDTPDWIEIHNAGLGPVDLDGWYLTDSRNDLTRWRFPATNILAGGYLVVFASEKDRAVPGAPLHTNFRLSDSGEYLGLVKPDGVTVVSAYAPVFPAQVADVSYGLPTVSAPVILVATTAQARVLVPTSTDPASDWRVPGFDDSGWLTGQNGVGFEIAPAGSPPLSDLILTDIGLLMHGQNASVYIRLPFTVADPAMLDILTLRAQYDDGLVAYLNVTEAARRNAPVNVAVVANSTNDFSGVQGQNGWFYGYYNKSADGDGIYESTDFIPFPAAEGDYSQDNYWNSTNMNWNWYLGDPPWTEINRAGGHPNGDNNGAVHWAIRRWTSTVSGNLRLGLHLAKSNVSCGNGVTGRIFHNGALIYSRTIAYNSAAGLTYTVLLPNVVVGDSIDLALGPEGTDTSASDGCDGTIFTAFIEHLEDLPLSWDTAASQAHTNSQAVLFEEIDLSAYLPGLTAGENILAVQGLNLSAVDTDFLFRAELVGRSRNVLRDQPRYFSSPTPGAPNDYGVDTLGPIVTDVLHGPEPPQDQDDLYVTAAISASFFPVASASLHYRVMFAAEQEVPMHDDGLSGDGLAGDGVFGAAIPASAAAPGEMVRWYVTATDSQGHASRVPAYQDPVNSPQYLGTVILLPQTNNLPLLHWFVQNPSAAATATGTKCSIYYLGGFYDNVNFNLHGQSSQGFPKKSYDVDFNPGNLFVYDPDEAPVDDINLLTTYPDKAKMRNMLAYATYRDADCPYHFVYPVRVQQNGSFWGDAHLVENGDANYLKRLGLDTRGALYKMYNTFQSAADTVIGINGNFAEKKTRKEEGNADLVELLAGLKLSGAARDAYLFDNINVPEVVNFLAAKIITADVDCCHKNYYFYRDTEGNREWWMTPWDVDLSFGRNWNSSLTYWDDTMHPANGLNVGNNNSLPQAIFNTAATLQMYRRRIRTLMDEQVQPPGLSPYVRKLEQEADKWYAMFAPDAELDLVKWGTWGNGSASSACCVQTLAEATGILKRDFLEPRRTYLYVTQSITNNGVLPLTQPADAVVNFAAIEYNPSSGNQAQEYIQLRNTNNYAVDISGWKLAGGIDFTFQGGTVLPANYSLYVSPDVNAFRARTSGPRGGQGLFVQGNYRGQLSARGETLLLLDKGGRLVQSNAYPANPSLAQSYLRITEIMYHPADPAAGSLFEADDHEFIELRNISLDTPVSLAGVRLIDGVQFNFSDGGIPVLTPGQRVLVVKNSAAFEARYGSLEAVAGQYSGSLENNGERIRLVDATGEEILDFRYNNNWYRITDGFGFSLVVVDEQAEPDAWSLPSNWRPSGQLNGGPAQPDPDPPAFAPILVNEVLTHTDNPPPTDSIELYNPTADSVNVGGWFLTDDFNTPKKYRIPNDTMIAGTGYLVFNETQFNPTPGVPPSFALGADGDEVWLFSGDAGGNLTGYFHGFAYGAAEAMVSFGRHLTSQEEEHFVAQSALTLGAANPGPKVGPVVISEIMYHPVDLEGAADNSAHEFVELYNVTDSPASLFHPVETANTWRLRGGIDFDFPADTTVPAGGHLLLVGFDPTNAVVLAEFRARYGLGEETVVLGPYDGRLDNAGESLVLLKPDLAGTNEPPYIVVDQVDYDDDPPWAAEADGTGASLQRVDPAAYGNDPANWTAAAPSPGSAYTGDTAPSILAQPSDQTGILTTEASLAVQAGGSAPLRYQWFHEGKVVPGGTNATLRLANVQLTQQGRYHVLVFNHGGATVSSNATLNLLIPAYISRQPEDVAIRAGVAASFDVEVFSSSTILYQWRFNGEPIFGATNASYVVTDVQPAATGLYDVVVTDDVASLVSSPASLTVLTEPTIVVHPVSQTNYVGGTVTFSVEVTNTANLPIGYRWRKTGAVLPNRVTYSHVDFLTLTDLKTTDAGNYSVVVTNQANYTPGFLSRTGRLTVLAALLDTDGDGLPDSYESALGLNPNDPDDAGQDLDGDGVSNRDEYIAGTDPQDPDSYLRVEIDEVSGLVVLRFQAVASKTYTVQYRDQVDNGPWQSLAGVPAVSDSSLDTREMEILDLGVGALGKRYYRLVTPGIPAE